MSEEKGAEGHRSTNEMVFESSQLTRMNVFDRSDTSKKLGKLDDLIIDAHASHVLYGILDTGVGGRNVLVPWSAFQLQETTDRNKDSLTLNKTPDQLANAPAFDKKHWPDFSDSTWQRQVYDFYGVRMAERPQESPR